MPHWTLKSTATKMLQNLSSSAVPRERKGSVDIHVHTQRSCFVEATNNHATCDPIGHRSRFIAPYSLPPKYEKEFSGGRQKPRPKPLSNSLRLPALPVVKFRSGDAGPNISDPKFAEIRNVADDENSTPTGPDEKAKGLVERNRRRFGMMYYPESVRDELRRARTMSGSPRVKMQLTPSSSSSFCGEIIISSAREDGAFFEPPSWFSIASESGDPSRFSLSTSDEPPSGRILSIASTPTSAKSWETFRIPSIPPSPVDSAPSPISAVPRDPRLPPADYLLYKEMYDDAMIKMHGKLPAEWVAYTHRHLPGPNRI
ncbi:hypothetical protein RhiXN_05367 [Rhizoctonia solani]|uniref:Uncharacterized protein n=1 Tax=Rhizoctonia solani TaxID=456999 RepID=A0A8H8NQ28_9AGAM|nr:uncharacterized protein RhiXN_05367 [Rhizoctonia solani]QRW17365.1 hypothetical protein RhiXN_05367 [Rhizoctonia solani]